MPSSYDVSASAVLDATPEVAYDAVMAAPLEEILGRRSGPIPGIARMEGQDGPWGTVGQTRTIVMTDGGRTLETLVLADRPSDYRYRITDVRGLMKPLVRSIDGRFTFVPEGSGTRVTWSWTLHPTALGRPGMGLLAFFWRRWAAGMFVRLGERVRV
jgi:hypothetical protein